jgi:tetratricopeptide (TPR) repeat protein
MLLRPHADLSVANRLVGNQRKSLEEASESYLLQQRSHKIDGNFWNIISNRGNDFLPNQPDSAIYYARKAYELALQHHSRRDWCLAAARVDDVYMKLGKYSFAKEYYTVALRESIAVGSVYIQAREYRDLARIFAKTGPADSSLFYAQLALMICEQYNFGDYGLQTSQIISNFYELKNKPDSALKYLKISLAGHDSILGQGKMQQFQAMLAGAEQKQRETTEAAERFQSRVKI